MPRITQWTLGVAVGTLLAAISATEAQTARSRLLVTTDWLASHLQDPGLVIIHSSGQRSDYDAGHVPGARWLPWQAYTVQKNGLSTELPEAAQLDSALEAIGVSDASRIIITGGPIQTTARLFFTLDYYGLGDRVALLDGGIDAWREEGRPVEREAAAATRGSVTLKPQPAKLADASWIAANAGKVKVLDARVPEFYAGMASNNNPRPGHLPDAGNVPFSWVTGELTRFRNDARLERLFAQAGVKRGDKVVSYCHVGMQATVVYLAAKLLGHDAAVYDGSFEDWSKRTDMPVVGPAVKPPQ
jgi:thiosulfate/3-mercaptopyruvate sulfurtransferase